MRNYERLYIGSERTARRKQQLDVIDSSTEEVIARVPEGTAADIDRAVRAARAAFEPWSPKPLQS